MTTEADARMVIDKLLEAASWQILNKAQVSTEVAVYPLYLKTINKVQPRSIEG